MDRNTLLEVNRKFIDLANEKHHYVDILIAFSSWMADCIGRTPETPGIAHQRAWDLLRQMRGHLADEDLISMEEYAWLAGHAPGATNGPGGGSPAPRRLESYDEMKRRLERYVHTYGPLD